MNATLARLTRPRNRGRTVFSVLAPPRRPGEDAFARLARMRNRIENVYCGMGGWCRGIKCVVDGITPWRRPCGNVIAMIALSRNSMGMGFGFGTGGPFLRISPCDDVAVKEKLLRPLEQRIAGT